jgi:methanogenic corrinoid protein MtbC1
MSLHEASRRAVATLQDEAVEFALIRLYTRFPDMLRRFGERGRLACKEDLRFHLSFLDGALAVGEARMLTDYVRWLASVLESRSIPKASLEASLTALAEFFVQNLPIDQARPVQDLLQASRAALQDPEGVTLLSHNWGPPVHTVAAGLAELLTRGDRAGARRIADQSMRDGATYLDLGVSLYQPALYRVGELWQTNRITVAQEHLATAMVQSALAQAFLDAEIAPPRAKQVVCACVEGNQHSLGLRLVADAFEIAGWDVTYLGASVPTRDLVSLVDAQRPALLALSVSTTFQLSALRGATTTLRGELQSQCPPILVGGLAANALPDLWRRLGADEWCADALQVHELARG